MADYGLGEAEAEGVGGGDLVVVADVCWWGERLERGVESGEVLRGTGGVGGRWELDDWSVGRDGAGGG